ncbi:TAT (twin-arginine translocation) pathway signal sequence [Amycolatopsis xylanica]|uniref:TAT (Twin-arginine translocation) pathway signal sequence n=1 Tax=Amycolatopsis xylanica TaxID=589385 RepID=A0A1H2YD54_9PSEU|nr:amidohydrolase family protein [Amycolatopsis xylanica]SDX03133.1 TAT (twin-arginine translocation) pathway signal sequence [Amycolatopsis xylanica]
MLGRRDFLKWVAAGSAGVALPGVIAPGARAAAADITVLKQVTVIDGTGAAPRRDMAVVLVGDRIAWLGRDRELPDVEGVRAADCRGKYVIPGLWDMHTHGLDIVDIFPPLYIANGVTGIREMWGYEENRAVRDRIEDGSLLGPRAVIGSSIVDGPISLLQPPVSHVANEAEARAFVRAEKALGAAFIKVYSYLGRDELYAIADEARRQGLTFAGHLPYRLSVAEASEAGQHSFEHLFGTPFQVSLKENEFLARLAATPIDPKAPRDFFNLARDLERQAMLEYSKPKADRLFARFVRNGTWQSPTLVVNRVISKPADTYLHDPRLKYIPADLEAHWADRIQLFAPKTPLEIEQQRVYLASRIEMVGAMHEAGVGIIGGTDCLNPYCFPGFSLHDELELMVEAGLSPMDALRAVTSEAARFLGLERGTGTITPGKSADLVVLDANPLDDIRNTQKIHAVVTRGRVIDRAAREKLLADVEAAASQPPAPARAATLRRLAKQSCC